MTTCTWKTKVCMRHTHCMDHTAVCGKDAVGLWEIRVLGRLMRYTVCRQHSAFLTDRGAAIAPL